MLRQSQQKCQHAEDIQKACPQTSCSCSAPLLFRSARRYSEVISPAFFGLHTSHINNPQSGAFGTVGVAIRLEQSRVGMECEVHIGYTQATMQPRNAATDHCFAMSR